MNLKDGCYMGIWGKGRDISYWICGPVFTVYRNPVDTIVDAKDTCHRIHQMCGDDDRVLTMLRDSTLAGEAYYNAILKVNKNGKRNKIPKPQIFYKELSNLIKEYQKYGFRFEEKADLVSAIFKKAEES